MEGLSDSDTRTRQIVRFGVFEVDLQAGELRRNGVKVRLQEQPFQVLRLLLANPGEIVTRSSLRDQLWPADTFVDFEHSVNAAIKRLRDALGDSAENPRFVETVARRGYRFVAPVNGTADKSTAADTARTIGKHTRVRWLVGGALAVLVAGITLGVYLGRRSPQPPQPQPIRLTANPADEPVTAAAISPDGRYLAFSDNTGFYLRQIETGETHAISQIPGSLLRPGSWYPDSAHLIVQATGQAEAELRFRADLSAEVTSFPEPSNERPALWQISVFGGEPRRLVEDGWFPAVSPDGLTIAFVRASRTTQEIWIMRADGAEPQKLAGENGDYFGPPVWSPDGAHLASARGAFIIGAGTQASIDIFDVKRGTVVAQFSPPDLGPDVAWTAGNRLIYALREPPPNQSDYNLWWIQLDGDQRPSGSPVRLTDAPGAIGGIKVSADGKRLMFLKQSWQPDVYIAAVEDNGTRISAPRRLTLDERQDLPYDWSADNKAIIFISDRSGSFKIYRQLLDRTTPDLLVGGPETVTVPRLNPDGTQILYMIYPRYKDSKAMISLMRIPLSGGSPQVVLQGSQIVNQQCARLPATMCIYSQAADGVLKFITFDPFKGKGGSILEIKDEVPLSYNWSLSPDGKMLALARGKMLHLPGGATIRLVSLANRVERTLTVRGWSGIGSLDWAADSRSLWLAGFAGGKTGLLNVSLQGRTSAVWTPRNVTLGWAIPSRDGKSLAFWQASGASNVWMLENFR